MLNVGDTAPDFTAIATDGSTISLHDYAGRNSVVLFFYPKDDTSGCTYEACAFRDAQPEYNDAGAVILGVSKDNQASHQAFTEKFNLTFPLLVDTDGVICDAYGVPHAGGWPKRTTFLIDNEGIIAHVWDSVNVKVHADEVLAAIGATMRR